MDRRLPHRSPRRASRSRRLFRPPGRGGVPRPRGSTGLHREDPDAGRSASRGLAGGGYHGLRLPQPGRGAVHPPDRLCGAGGRVSPGHQAAARVHGGGASGQAPGAGDRAGRGRAPPGRPAAQARGARASAPGRRPRRPGAGHRRDDRGAAGLPDVRGQPPAGRHRRGPSSARGGARGRARPGPQLRRRARSPRRCAARRRSRRGCRAGAIPTPIRRALPAAQRPRHREGGRGHRLLRLRAAALAERGRRRARDGAG